MDSKVDQDCLDMAAKFVEDGAFADAYRNMLAKAFARMKVAGRQAGLREAAEVAVAKQKPLYSPASTAYNEGCRDAAAAITALSGEGRQ